MRTPRIASLFAIVFGFILLGAAPPPSHVRADATDLFFSEYMEGSGFNKAVEIHNGTGATVNMGGYVLELYSNGAATPSQSVTLTGSVADGDVFVVSRADADPALVAQADQLVPAVMNHNGDDAIALRKSGVLIDVIGQIGVDPGTEWGTGAASTADNTLRRKATVCAGDTIGSDAFDPATEWDGFATNTLDGFGSHTADCSDEPASVVINEFSASTAGTDVEYVEILAAPSTDYSALTVIEIEGDAGGTALGTVDEVIALGSTNAAGFYLANLPANALENGTLTLLLVEGFTGALGNDLDTNDDGTFDTTPWTSIADAVAVNDGGAGDITYGVPSLGVAYDGLAFAPGGASRIPDGEDTDTAADWVRNDFDLAGIPTFSGTPVEGEAYNTPGEPNEAVEVIPEEFSCTDSSPITRIHAVQGAGATSSLVGTQVVVDGVVVGDFQNNASVDNGQLNGFYVQEETADADVDPSTSEGIFVFSASTDVANGQHVRIKGTVTEFTTGTPPATSQMTELTNAVVAICDTPATPPAATAVMLPVASVSDLERYEGMLVTFPQSLAISEFFNFDRFNEIVLTVGRQMQPTAMFDPGSTDAAYLASLNARSRITLDDGRSNQNPDPAIHPNGDEFTLANRFRGGDTVQGASGVFDHTFGLYRIHPTADPVYTAVNERASEPGNAGGTLTVSSFNVLNYFTTLTSAGNVCGPSANMECRGANDANEFTRQRNKIIAALAEIDADVFGLIEIENHPTDAAIANLVDGLNATVGAGTYEYIETGAVGTDAIRVAVIFKPATVTPVGEYALLTSAVDPTFIDTLNRPVMAQTFEENATGEVFTVAVNHLKSKGSDCNAVGDPDTGDGSANCNGTRTEAAEAEANWLATDPTGSGDPDFLIIGDLNAYDKETPIDVLIDAGYIDLVRQFEGEEAYSYLFDGQLGYLDHALANETLTPQIAGVTTWHINSDEPDILDYDTSFKEPAQEALYEANAFRSSDHDPVIVGLSLESVDVDTDADGVPDDEDNCPRSVNPGQQDRDNDGKGNSCDADGLVPAACSAIVIDNVIRGTTGNNNLTGTAFNDLILALSGNDTVQGGDGDDCIDADNGNDVVDAGEGNDVVIGLAGNDVINAGPGNNTVHAGNGDDEVRTGSGSDLITAADGNDVIESGDGGDTIDAGNGNNEVRTGSGADQVTTGSGNDVISTGDGADTIDSGNGNDSIDCGAASDTANSGSGNDINVGGRCEAFT